MGNEVYFDKKKSSEGDMGTYLEKLKISAKNLSKNVFICFAFKTFFSLSNQFSGLICFFCEKIAGGVY